MLILSRKPGEIIYIGDGIRIMVTEILPGRVRVGIEAPADVMIVRGELMTPGQLERFERKGGSGGETD